MAVGYSLSSVYQDALSAMIGQTAAIEIVMIYPSVPAMDVTPPSGFELLLDAGNLDFSLEAILLGTTDGSIAEQAFQAFAIRKTTQDVALEGFSNGKLVKTVSCNYELAESQGESAPRDVIKEFGYDKYGNTIRIVETNPYVEDPARRIHVVQNLFDSQDRLIQKTVCGELNCDPALSHVEKYLYDQLGRQATVLDKQGSVIAQNHYNFIGQLSAKGLGGELVKTTTTKALIQRNEYHLHGWLKANPTERLKNGSLLFQEQLSYEDGFPARLDGLISGANLFYDRTLGSRNDLEYSFKYDELDRLTNAYDITESVKPDGTPNILEDRTTAYDYLQDGRLAHMERDGLAGDYHYNAFGRLESVTGNLIPDRQTSPDMDGQSKFHFDAVGNLVEDGSKAKGGHPFKVFYRSDNLPYLFVYGVPGTTMEYKEFIAYGEGNTRISRRITADGEWKSSKSYFDIGSEIREADGSPTAEYFGLDGLGRTTYDPGFPSGRKEFYLKNHLGSTQEVYNLEDANISYATLYFPYGKQFAEFNTASQKVTERFTGKELDEDINLSYFGGRFYDADLGLWISCDPNRQNHSPYTYSSDDPMNFLDPDGLRDIFAAFYYNQNSRGKTVNADAQAIKLQNSLKEKYPDDNIQVKAFATGKVNQMVAFLNSASDSPIRVILTHSSKARDKISDVPHASDKQPNDHRFAIKDLDNILAGKTGLAACEAGITVPTDREDIQRIFPAPADSKGHVATGRVQVDVAAKAYIAQEHGK